MDDRKFSTKKAAYKAAERGLRMLTVGHGWKIQVYSSSYKPEWSAKLICGMIDIDVTTDGRFVGGHFTGVSHASEDWTVFPGTTRFKDPNKAARQVARYVNNYRLESLRILKALESDIGVILK